jgi:precorrin-6B methylase 2
MKPQKIIKYTIVGGVVLGTVESVLPFLSINLLTIIFLITTLITLTYVVSSKILTKHFYKGAPYVQSRKKVIQTMVELAKYTQGELIADLGSGNGKIAIQFAKKGADVIGFEINPLLSFVSKLKVAFLNLEKNITIKKQNFWDVNLSEFDVITVFGIEYMMQDLEKKLLSELKTGARVLSNKFQFPNWKHTNEKDGVYLYRMD